MRVAIFIHFQIANSCQLAAIPTESDAESVAEGQITPKAEPSAKQAKTELKDTVMKEAEAQNAEPEGEEEEESGDENEYQPVEILGHRADFDEVMRPSPFPGLGVIDQNRNLVLPQLCAIRLSGTDMTRYRTKPGSLKRIIRKQQSPCALISKEVADSL